MFEQTSPLVQRLRAKSEAGSASDERVYTHDAFISYSRKDKGFAARLDKALESYKPPKDLPLPQRFLDVFRDESDFTGVEYHSSIENHLKRSAKLIVVCSPHARRSPYVNDEIRRFVRLNGPKNIIPVLLAGVPNNEAQSGQEEDMAFPEALCEVMQMPLATNYLGFDLTRDKINKGGFDSSWYALLANIYDTRSWGFGNQCRFSPDEKFVATESADRLVRIWDWKSGKSVYELRGHQKLVTSVAYSPDGGKLVSASADGTAKIWSPHTGSLLLTLAGHREGILRAGFSPDGKWIVTASRDKSARVWDASTRGLVSQLREHQGAGTDASFTRDGKFLVTQGTVEKCTCGTPPAGAR